MKKYKKEDNKQSNNCFYGGPGGPSILESNVNNKQSIEQEFINPLPPFGYNAEFRKYLSDLQERGKDDLFWKILQQQESSIDIQCRYVSENGDLNKVLILLRKGAKDYNEYLFNACAGGKINIAEYMINKGANDFKRCLDVAKQYRQLKMIRFMEKCC